MRSAALIVLLLAGCQTNAIPNPPTGVEWVVTKTVPVKPELTKDCDLVPKRDNTVKEAARLANARLASLEECTARMRLIRGLGQP